MKFNNHGTYIKPKRVVEIARIPAVFVFEKNCRRQRPRTNKIRKLVSKSFTLAGDPVVPRLHVRLRNVPSINRTPPSMPHSLKHTSDRFSASP